MKRSTGIRLLLLLAVAALCGGAYAIGYVYSVRQSEKELAGELALLEAQRREEASEEEDPADSRESAAEAVAYEYVLGEQDGYVIVYYADGRTVYSVTDIPVEYLSPELQREISAGKPIASEEALYNFLESYSS